MPPPFQSQGKSLAELSRPARELKKKIKDKTRKPQGAKPKKVARPAKYVNWFSPLSWSQIEAAARVVGWMMSSGEIVRELQKRNPDTFGRLNQSTVRGWIDRSGDRPRWSDAVLARIPKGNDPGHQKGGRRGILV